MTRRILVPVDGSACSDRAVGHLIRTFTLKGEAAVDVLHVAPEISVRGIDPDSVPGPVGRLEREEEERRTKSARDLIDKAGVPYECRYEMGDPAETIVRHCRVHACDEIIMGARGLGALGSLVLGSVANKVLHLVDVPVTLVK